MTGFIITESNRDKAKSEIDKLDPTAKWVMTIDKLGTKRSILQNDLSHAWYKQLAKELPDDNVLGWKNYCKLNYGVPILRADDIKFKEFYDGAIKNSFSYEQKLNCMNYFPITSLMNTKQLSFYLDMIQDAFRGRVNLEFSINGYFDE